MLMSHDAVRAMASAIALVCAVALLAGCASSDSAVTTDDPSPVEPSTEASSPEASSSGTDEVAFPLTVEHVNGTATIEAPAERAVSLTGEADLEWMVALGVEPIAYATRGQGEWPLTGYQEPLPDDAQYLEVGDSFLPSLEELAALDPDVMTGFGFMLQENHDQLEQISPAVGYDTADDFRATGTLLAQALGVPAEGERVIAELDAELQAAKDELGDVSDVSIALVNQLADGGIRFLSPSFNAGGFVYDELGFADAPAFADLDLDLSDDPTISAEQVAAVAADVVLCLTGEDDASQQFCEDLPDDELADLPQDTVLVTTTFSQVINTAAPGGLRAMLELLTTEVAPQLADG